MDYLSWSQRLKLDDIPLLVKHCRVAGPVSRSALTERELGLLNNMIGRLSRLAEVAVEVRVCHALCLQIHFRMASATSLPMSLRGLAMCAPDSTQQAWRLYRQASWVGTSADNSSLGWDPLDGRLSWMRQLG